MGRFLAIGITTKITINKSEIDEAKFDFAQVMEKMKNVLFFQPDIYTKYEHENYFVFELKDEIFRLQLINLLKEIYPLLYEESDRYNKVLDTLGFIESSKWLEWAKDKAEEAFQFDPYGMSDHFYGKFGNRIHINYESILLSLGRIWTAFSFF